MWTYQGAVYPDLDAVCAVIEASFPGHRVGRDADFISVRQPHERRHGFMSRGAFVAGFDVLLRTGAIVPSSRKPINR